MEHFFRILLRLYPPGFRRRFEQPMVDLFREEWADCAGRGRRERYLLVAGVVVDSLLTAARAWLAVLARDPAHDASPRSFSVEGIRQDIRYALRSFARRPGFTAVVVLTLAFGIGANTAIFTLVNEIVLRPLAIGDPERVVDLAARVPGGNSFTGFSYADYLDYSERSSGVLEGLAAFTARQVRLGPGAEGESIVAMMMTPGYFEVLAVEPQIGARPDAGGQAMGAVISHAFWQSRFGGDPDVLGATLRLNDRPFTVVGVGPEGFSGTFIGFPTQVWIALRSGELILPGFELDDPETRGLEFIARLAYGVDREQARAALDVISARLEREHPVRNKGVRVAVHATTGIDYSMRGGVLGFLGLLMVVAGLVLLITCLNVGGMLLARAAARGKEMSIRFALGAGAGRLVRQLLTETLVVFFLGGLAAVFVARQLTDALPATLSDIPAGGFELAIDWRVWLFTASASLVASLVASLLPAKEALDLDLVTGLGAGRGSEGRRAGRLRRLFVVAQIAAAVALLIGAGLFLRSLRQGESLDPGFEADRVATARLSLGDEIDLEIGWRSLLEIRRRLAQLPGVESVALAARRPIGVTKNPIDIEVAGFDTAGDGGFFVDSNAVGVGYFDTLELALLAGRDFRADEGEGAARVAIVNDTLARRFWPTEEALGQSFRLAGESVTVIGIAADSRYLIQDGAPSAHVYFPLARARPSQAVVLLRTADDPTRLAGELRRVVAEVLPSQAPADFATLRHGIDRSLLPQRLASAVMTALGSFGLLLASLGIYGILAHSVHRRRREIGIRLALGGRRQEIVRLIVGSGLRLTSAGIGVGALLALAMAPLLSRFLIGVVWVDGATFVLVAGVFLAVGVLACLFPALRAARIDPTRSLRLE